MFCFFVASKKKNENYPLLLCFPTSAVEGTNGNCPEKKSTSKSNQPIFIIIILLVTPAPTLTVLAPVVMMGEIQFAPLPCPTMTALAAAAAQPLKPISARILTLIRRTKCARALLPSFWATLRPAGFTEENFIKRDLRPGISFFSFACPQSYDAFQDCAQAPC